MFAGTENILALVMYIVLPNTKIAKRIKLIFVYWAMILKARKTAKISDVLDEKQIQNIIRAGAVTLSVVSGIMLIMFFWSSNNVFTLEGKIWFLSYFFITLVTYSASTLFYFKRA